MTWCSCAAWTVALGCSDGASLRPPTEPAKVGGGDAGAGNVDTAGKSSGHGGSAGGELATNGGSGGDAGMGNDAAGGAEPQPDGGAPPDAVAGAGGEYPSNPGPRETACTGQRAFVAHSGSFVAPTDKELAQALNEDIFDQTPITFVLLGEGESPRVAASYSQDDAGLQAFHEGIAPEPTSAWVDGDAFGSATAQPHGYLLVEASDGPLEIPLDNLSYTVTTSGACTKGVATISGVIPASRADLVDKLTGVDSGDPELPDREDPKDTPVSAIFSVEIADFDFGSVP